MPNALFLTFIVFLAIGTAATLLTPNPTVIRAQAVVVAARITGAECNGCREVELDVMVRRPEGGQFPARETTVVPTSAMAMVCPGSFIDTYYLPGDESAVDLRVSRG
jgi:hypothetical protein